VGMTLVLALETHPVNRVVVQDLSATPFSLAVWLAVQHSAALPPPVVGMTFVLALETHPVSRVVVQVLSATPFSLAAWLAVQHSAALPLPVVFALETHPVNRVVVQDLQLAFFDLPTDIPHLGCLITREWRWALPRSKSPAKPPQATSIGSTRVVRVTSCPVFYLWLEADR
jgi:hypothetical protein